MFSRSSLILLLITSHSLISTAKLIGKARAKREAEESDSKEGDGEEGGKKKVSKAPKLKPEQIEGAKKFWKNLLSDHKKGIKGEKTFEPKGVLKPMNDKDLAEKEKMEKKAKEEHEREMEKDKKGIKHEGAPTESDEETSSEADGDGDDGEGKQAAPPHVMKYTKTKNKYAMPMPSVKLKMMHSGGMVFLDGLMQNYVPLGDRYHGMPDGLFSMGKYCAEFIIKGALGVIYMTVRWPHKIMLKVIVFTSAAIWIVNHALWCLNPFSISNWISKSKMANQKFDELADICDKFKVRLANTIDRVFKLDEIQKQACCAYQAWKQESVDVVPEAAKDFIENWFDSMYKLELLLFCGEYAEGADNCGSANFIDEEPLRIMPRGQALLWCEIFLKFF